MAPILRASGTYCVGVTERSCDDDLLHNQMPYLNVAFGLRIWLCIGPKEKRKERRAQ